jgi:cellulose synthase/poly-beta-1,6-N-acetylglucosamine synthase-like glycosyltransferase
MIDIAAAAPTLFIIGAALTLLPLVDREPAAGRAVPCLLCIALMFRAFIWRATSTLPPFALSPGVVWAYVFFAGEVACTVSGSLLFLFLSRTIDRRPQSQHHQDWVATERMRVDIFIATYNEEEEILDRTIVGAKSQDYEYFRVFVLDDGRRDWLRELCQRRGVGYITRPDNEHAKAGNLNHGLKWLAQHGGAGEFIAILDADFVPQPNFLRRALALFHDADVGSVQTPQHFFNPDPLQHGFEAAHLWPDEQRFFFDVLLASKDAWGVAFCCGTSSVTRRKALEQVGGFPTESVTEDMLLSFKLKELGWKTAYLNERLSMGLAPEGVSEYITQRGRWCLGFMQIARSKWGVLGSANLSAIDRISLFDSFLYWGTSFPFRILCLIAPVIYGFTGLAVIKADAQGVLDHYAPSFCTPVIVLAWITRGRVLPIITDAAQLLVTVDAIKAATVGLFKPKGHKFKVTAKGGERDRLKVQWALILRFLLPLLLATLGAVAYGTFYVFSPVYGNQNAPIWLFWSYCNAIVIAVTIFTCIELPRPKSEGFRIDETARLTIGPLTDRRQVLVLSTSWAMLSGRAAVPLGAGIVLQLQGVSEPLTARVSKFGKDSFEVTFDTTPSIHEAIIRKLFSGRYQLRPARFRFADVVAAIAGRFAS